MPLDLGLPAERAPPPKDLEVRPKHVKTWVESLPLAQTLDSARKLCAHLAAVNRSKVDTDDRLQILDIHRPVAAVLLEELDDIYGKATLPLGPRGRESLIAARELAGAIAEGYRIAIVEKAAKRLAFGVKKQIPLLVLRAMEYLGIQMRASYKSYAPIPAGAWKELHQLYIYADQEGVAGEAVEAEGKATILETYSEALLLSLCDPYRLVPGELDKVLGQVRSSRAAATLGQQNPGTRAGGHFLVPCDTDRAPKPAISVAEEAGGPNWRLFDCNPVVDKLRARKLAFETGNVSATMSKAVGPDAVELIARLITLWGDPPKRAYRREEMDTSVAICVGLKAIGHYVSASAASATQDAEAEAEVIREGITIPLLAVPGDDASKTMPVFEWDVVNQSEGGLKVRRTAATPQAIGVGEVVGIKVIGRPYWTVGVVRWITALEEGGLEFGAQFFAPAACAVWIQPVVSAGPQAKFAVLLADDDEASTGESLLTSPNTYSELREFDIEGEGLVSRVRAAGLIEKTSRFELFHVLPS
jgi:hypothetical protein